MEPTALFLESPCRHFTKSGPANTEACFDAVNRRARELAIGRVVLATSSGRTALEALKRLDRSLKIIAVTRVTGFKEPNIQELKEEDSRALKSQGVEVLTCAHAFGGVGRGVRNLLSTYQVDEIMAHTLRIFGHGAKVAVEIAMMAADAGLVRTDENVIAIGGTTRGADTALVLRPATSHHFFDLWVSEVICKPANP